MLRAKVTRTAPIALATLLFLPQTPTPRQDSTPGTIFIPVDPLDPSPAVLAAILGNAPPPTAGTLTKASTVDKIRLDHLCNESVQVSTESTKSTREGRLFFFGGSQSKTTYKLTQDYLKYKTVSIDGTLIKVGVGVRITATVRVKDAGINVTGLTSLGIAASRGRASGSLNVSVIGISGRDVTSAFPFIADISVDSISQAVQAMALVKSKIYQTADEERAEVKDAVASETSPTTTPLNRRANALSIAIEPQIVAVQANIKRTDKDSIQVDAAQVPSSAVAGNPSFRDPFIKVPPPL